jgi:hypothetical protein
MEQLSPGANSSGPVQDTKTLHNNKNSRIAMRYVLIF